MNTIEQQLKDKDEVTKKEGFNKWLNEPLTKVVLSSVSHTGDNDALLELLRSAYTTGFACGSGTMALSFFTSLMDKPRR